MGHIRAGLVYTVQVNTYFLFSKREKDESFGVMVVIYTIQLCCLLWQRFNILIIWYI